MLHKIKVTKNILYRNKTISDMAKEMDLTPERVRQLLWMGMRDMKNKTIKPVEKIDYDKEELIDALQFSFLSLSETTFKNYTFYKKAKIVLDKYR